MHRDEILNHWFVVDQREKTKSDDVTYHGI